MAGELYSRRDGAIPTIHRQLLTVSAAGWFAPYAAMLAANTVRVPCVRRAVAMLLRNRNWFVFGIREPGDDDDLRHAAQMQSSVGTFVSIMSRSPPALAYFGAIWLHIDDVYESKNRQCVRTKSRCFDRRLLRHLTTGAIDLGPDEG